MTKPMRILMVSTYFHPIVGGAERQALGLAKELIKAGHSVTVATCRFSGLSASEIVEGIQVHRAIRPIARGPVYATSYLASLIAFLIRERRRYDLIHAHLLFLDAAAAGALRARVRKPVVAKAACGGAHGDVARLKQTPFGSLVFSGVRRADRIVATSRQVEQELVGHGVERRRIIQIPNGVDTERFRPAADRDAVRRAMRLTGRVVVFVGRLHPQKGLTTLCEAWAVVAARCPDATLLMVGGGPQDAELKQLTGRLQLADRIRFCGEQRDVLPSLQAADLFVLPSLSEGLSNALLEAMACGLACVATRIGGNVDLVTDGETGLLVEPGHPQALAEAMIRVLDDEAARKRLGAAARLLVEGHYTMTAVSRQYLALYAELLNGGAHVPAC